MPLHIIMGDGRCSYYATAQKAHLETHHREKTAMIIGAGMLEPEIWVWI